MHTADRLGCSICFAAMTTQEERTRDECTDCHRRRIARAVDEWRAFEGEHADELDQD